ncbi:MAG: hypothetical protein ACYDCK_02400 [Thermoplasmatota archaeon]
MLVAYYFEAAPGKEKEFEAHLDQPEFGVEVARWMGATRNTLFLRDGKMFRVFEFPDGVKPVPLLEIAAREPAMRAFMKKLGTLTKIGFDLDDAASFARFNDATRMALAFDVRP